MPDNNDSGDNFGVVRKLTSGQSVHLGDIAATTNSALGLAGDVGKFVPGVSDVLPYSTPISTGLRGVEVFYQNKLEQERLVKEFGAKNSRRNRALRQKLEKGVDWVSFAGHAAASLGGVALGGLGAAFTAAFLFPMSVIAAPILGIIGGTIGGVVANSMYSTAFDKQEQDPIGINERIIKMHRQNGYVPSEFIFGALAANLPEESGKRMEELLYKYTGTKSFMEALTDHKNIPKVTAMMNDQKVDQMLRVAYSMPQDPQNQFKTVAEQYGDMINSGYMRPERLLNNREGAMIMTTMARAQEQALDVPVTPGAKQNQVSKA